MFCVNVPSNDFQMVTSHVSLALSNGPPEKYQLEYPQNQNTQMEADETQHAVETRTEVLKLKNSVASVLIKTCISIFKMTTF